MENLATEGKGTMLAASSGAELMDVFEQIGHGCSAVNGFVEHFSHIVTSMVADKITVDHM